mmetsp:Transcript_30086/g.64850  ORF Transcript_30086/g.64850 Transcript_30086/m.64850 type:complete len:224 (-) Transcript_30086:409-1080(-)
MALGFLTFLGEALHGIEAHEEVPKGIVAIKGIVVLQEWCGICLRCIDEFLAVGLVAQQPGHELFVVQACSEKVGAKIRAGSWIGTLPHIKSFNQVLLNHLLNVQLAAADGHGGSQLQVIGVVGVDLPWFPNEFHIFVDAFGTAHHITRLFVAGFGFQTALHRRGVAQVLLAPAARRPGVGLLAGVAAPEAAGEGQQHPKGDRGSEVTWIFGPPIQVFVHWIVQ